MEEKENLKGHKRNKNTLIISTVLYIAGLFFLFIGVKRLFNDEILLGVIYILNGIILIPVTADAIGKILIGIIGTPVITDAIEKNNIVLHKIFLLVTNSIRYFLVLVFLLGGVGSYLEGKIIPGVIYILMGIILIPVIADPITDFIEQKMNL